MKKRLYLCTVILFAAVLIALWADVIERRAGNEKAASAIIPNTDSSTIIQVPYEEPGIEASYPQLQTGGTKEQLELWNSLIFQDFKKILQIYSFHPMLAPTPSPGEQIPIILTITNEVMSNTDKILSIMYIANFNYKYAAHPTGLAYTTNIDKVEGRKLKLSDVIEINQEFLQSFRTWDYIKVGEEAGKVELEQAVRDYIAGITNEELALGFLMADQIGSKNLYGIYSYYRDDIFGIVMEVPNYLGDYARFEIERSQLKKYLK